MKNKTILVRGGSAVGALVLLAGCTATRTGSASPSNSPDSAAATAGGSSAVATTVPGAVLRSAVVLTGTSTSVSTRTVPTATSPRATATTSSTLPTATPTVTVTRIAVVTSTSTSSPTADAADAAAPAPDYSCPTPAELEPSHHNTAVECFDGNHWLVTSGVYGDGEPADGIGVVHQTSPGVYQVVDGGSDLAGLDEKLKSEGVPDDLVAHLAEGKALDHRTRYDHPLADFLTTWDRHTSELVLSATDPARCIWAVAAATRSPCR